MTRGVVFMVHGYGIDISWTFQATPIFLAKHGYACFAIDLQGHGQSQGLKAYVPSIDLVVDDVISFLNFIQAQNSQYKNVPKFLFGESMGGGICLLIHFKLPNMFKGAIFLAPLCKISEKLQPSWPVSQILSLFARVAPTLPVLSTNDLLEKTVNLPEKRIIAAMNPMRYTGKDRSGTVVELLRVTNYVSSRLCDVELPFIVLHGTADVVTHPQVSKDLYDCAKSEDKSIKIYNGMLHSLLFGETDENVDIVRSDILTWLNSRS